MASILEGGYDLDALADSVAALGTAPRRVFLTVGRTDIAVFARAPQHDYVARTIEPVGGALPVPVDVVEQRTVGATLGADAIEAMVKRSRNSLSPDRAPKKAY